MTFEALFKATFSLRLEVEPEISWAFRWLPLSNDSYAGAHAWANLVI